MLQSLLMLPPPQGGQVVRCSLETRQRLLDPRDCATMGAICIGRAEVAGHLPTGTSTLEQEQLGMCVVHCLIDRGDSGNPATLVPA